MDYVQAVVALYQAPHGEFVAERKRLAAELKTAGDRDGAKTLAKLGRPPISAWAVNQLYWHARDAFDRLMATAAQLREGDLSASPAHREALAKLRQRAAAMLADAGHNANEATLRRTAQTLSAIAALGTFAPDPPGALATDRDPPGFEAAGMVLGERPAPALSVVADAPAEADPDDDADADADDDRGDDDAGDDEGTDDPDISTEEREAAADLLRAVAVAKPARHLSAVPAKQAVRTPDRPVRTADSPVRNADNVVRLTDRAVRAADDAASKSTRAANDGDPPPKRARHLSAVPLSEAPADDLAERDRIAAVRHAAVEQAEQAERIAAARQAQHDEEKRRARERDRLATALRTARGEVESRRRTVEQLRSDLARAETATAEAAAIVADLERALAALEE